MNNKHYVGKRVASLESYGRTRPVDGIALVVDEEHEYRAGDQTGYVLEIECPYGTQAMADALMAQLGGRSYTGYTAANAVMDPEAELGDGVTVGGGYELLASRQMTLGSGHLQIGAPPDSETDHEYGVADPTMRWIERKLASTRSYIDKTAESIRIGVEQQFEGLSQEALTSVTAEYYSSTSSTRPTGGSWSASQPAWTQGKFIWSRQHVRYGDGSEQYLPSANGVCITGNTGAAGEQGAPGKDGAAGKNGVGISKVEAEYYRSTSETRATGGTWQSTVPALTDGTWLWTRTKTTYTDGNVSYTEAYNMSKAMTESIGKVVDRVSKLEVDTEGIHTLVSETVEDVDGLKTNYSSIDQRVDSITSTVEGYDGRFTKIEQTADSITERVDDAEGNISTLQRTATSVTDSIESINGDINTLTRTATSLESSIKSANGDISTLKQTAKSLTSSIESANGDISTLKQTATSLASSIQSANGEITTLKQTASGLTSTVGTLTGTGGGSIGSMIRQEIDKIKLTVTGSLGGEASITLSGGGGGSGKIDLSGVRKAFADDDSSITISAGTVTFNAGKFISTGENFNVDAAGKLTANKAKLAQLEAVSLNDGYAFPYTMPKDASAVFKGDIDLLPYESTDSYSSSIYGWAYKRMCLVYATHLDGEDWSCLGFNGNVWLRCGNEHWIRADKGINERSDRDIKKDIKDLDGKYIAFLDAIPPVSFRYKEQSGDAPLAIGYIAQDVEAALGKAGLTRDDFGGLRGTDGSGDMGITYSDFIPILHLKINDLEKRLRRLEVAV